MIKIQTYNINKTITLTKDSLTQFISKFWNEIFATLDNKDNIHLMLLVKVQFVNDEVRTLANMRKVNFTDNDLFTKFLVTRLGILTDNYKDTPFTQIIFTYIINDGLNTDDSLLHEHETHVFTHSYNNMQLPLTMVPSEYGEILVESHNGKNSKYSILSGDRNYVIDSDGITNNVRIPKPMDLNWTDTKLSDTIFKREIMKDTLYVKEGEIVVKEKQLNAKPFSTCRVEKKISLLKSFMTIDIETVLIDNKQVPYLICGYSNGQYIHSFASDLTEEGVSKMFSYFIYQLLSPKFKNVQYIYAHNFSGFDGILLLKHLLDHKAKPLIFNNKLMSIKINVTDHNSKKPVVRTIEFKDSFLLLPMGLRKLCDSFKVKTVKTNFPFNLSDINYSGEFPSFDKWTGLTQEQYEEIKTEHGNKPWSFRDEAIKYCKIDCLALFEVLTSFNKLVFSEFKVNVHPLLTLPALAMKIYKSQYMPKNSLFQILGNVEEAIRQSYTGGAVDVYITNNHSDLNIYNNDNNYDKLYYYDVNSLYPTVMATQEMPIGKPIAFEGDIRSVDPEAFGFFYCEITSPEYIEHPILQRRIKTKDGTRTIAGLGSWEGWIFSGEMDNAVNYGYSFNIIRGYKFAKKNIFKGYVEKLYKLRLEYPSGTPMNLVAKLLMNSLYGKFGMKPENACIDIYDQSSEGLASLQSHIERNEESIQDIIKLDKHTVVVTGGVSIAKYNQVEDIYHGLDVNIAIASAVTSGARMIMSNVKNREEFDLYYTDTDSIVINKPLPSEMVGSSLGQFKLEHEITKAVFLAPKVYGFETSDGQEIVKIKGVAKEHVAKFGVSDLNGLLILESSKLIQQKKWYKDTFQGTIEVADVAYQLKATSNKRQARYMPVNSKNGNEYNI
jgi:hypothetical protein